MVDHEKPFVEKDNMFDGKANRKIAIARALKALMVVERRKRVICPVCRGKGIVVLGLSYPVGSTHERNPYQSEWDVTEACPQCKGKRVVDKVRNYEQVEGRRRTKSAR